MTATATTPATTPAAGAWFGRGVHLTGTIAGAEYHLKRTGGAWSVYLGDPAGKNKIATAAGIADAKAAAEAHGLTALPTIRFMISGKAMTALTGSHLYTGAEAYVGADPDAARRAGAALRSAPRSPQGKGFQFHVDCDPAAAAVIADYCTGAGDALADVRGRDARDTCLALRAVADRIAALTDAA